MPSTPGNLPENFRLMANHKSALKRVRQTKTRTARNRDRKLTIKSLRKETLAAVGSGDAKAAGESRCPSTPRRWTRRPRRA